MFKGLGQLASLMRGAGEISSKLEGMTEALGEKRVVGSSGGDMVRVEMNGLAQVIDVAIDPCLLNPSERELLQHLLAAAVNQAAAKANETRMAVLRDLAGGFELLGFEKLWGPSGSGEADDS